jgi:predicted nucleotidyltransferase
MMTNYSAIGDVLFTKTQQRVLGLLYGQPAQSYYLNELVRLADIGKGTVRRELEKLCTVGLITVRKQGNQNHYQANPANPVFTELKGIVDKTFGVAGVLKTVLQPIIATIDFAFVYGSVAKGNEHAASDIDLMLVADNLSYTEVMDLLLEAEQILGRTVNPTLYTHQEFDDRLQQQQSFVSRVVMQNTLWLQGEVLFADQYREFTKKE